MSGPKLDFEERARARDIVNEALDSPEAVAVRFVELERHRLRLAEALKRPTDAIAAALVYHGHVFDDRTHDDLTRAEKEARAALREAGVEDA